MPSAPKWSPPSPALVATPESGEIQLREGEQTLTQIFTGTYDDCRAAALPSGTLGTGDTEDMIVRECRVLKSKGGVGRVIFIWGGFVGDGETIQLPADKFALNPYDMSPNMETNPMYANATADWDLLGIVRAAGLVASETSSKIAYQKLLDYVAVPMHAAKYDEALVLADCLRTGRQNYYRAVFTYVWQTYSLTEPTVTVGGFRESPGGPLSSLIAGLSLSCLREADFLDFSDGLYALTRSWKCGPAAQWPDYIYP